jgi:hypothetical protein
MSALNFWSTAAGSTSLAVMLANPNALLTTLAETGNPGTAEQRLRYIKRV